MFTNGLIWVCHLWVRVEKTDSGKTLFGKENIPGTTVSKEGDPDSLLGHEEEPSLLISLKKVQL